MCASACLLLLRLESSVWDAVVRDSRRRFPLPYPDRERAAARTQTAAWTSAREVHTHTATRDSDEPNLPVSHLPQPSRVPFVVASNATGSSVVCLRRRSGLKAGLAAPCVLLVPSPCGRLGRPVRDEEIVDAHEEFDRVAEVLSRSNRVDLPLGSWTRTPTSVSSSHRASSKPESRSDWLVWASIVLNTSSESSNSEPAAVVNVEPPALLVG